MTAYVFVSARIFDTSFVQGYLKHVPAILHKHGGALVALSNSIGRREGEGPAPDMVVLLSFPSIEAIDAFLANADYQPHRAARRSASSSDMLVFAA